MSNQTPISWEREFDPEQDLPPEVGARELYGATAEQLSRWKLPLAPLGDFIFAQTREIELPPHIEAAQGRSEDDWVYYVRNGRQFVRAYTPARDPKSGYQLDQRFRMKQAQLGWWEHTREQREAWDDFAATIPSRAKDIGRRAKRVGRRAYRLYISAQLNRLGMGLPVTGDAPVRKCAHWISDVELVAAPQSGQLAFRLFHQGNRPEGIRVLVEMTRGTKHDKRKPLERELTRAGLTDAGSYFPLGDNGATYVLEQPRYAVAPGQRFGLQVTLVTEDGLRSRSYFEDEFRWLDAAGDADDVMALARSAIRGFSTTGVVSPALSLAERAEIDRRHKVFSDAVKEFHATAPMTEEEEAQALAESREFRRKADEAFRLSEQRRLQAWEETKRQ